MSVRNKFIGMASALAFAACIASPASAMSGFSGTLSADYTHVSVDGGHANVYGGSGSGAYQFASGIALQADAGYHYADADGGHVSNWNIDAVPFWRFGMGRVGVDVGYNNLSADAGPANASAHVTNYGAFGEWFIAPWATAAIKGGGFSTNASLGLSGFGSASGSENGSYAGGELKGYVFPDFSLAGTIDYSDLNHDGHVTAYGGQAEYLLSERMPVSIYGGYTYAEYSGSAHSSTWMIGIRFHCNERGSSSLASRDRSGPVGWASQFNVLNQLF